MRLISRLARPISSQEVSGLVLALGLAAATANAAVEYAGSNTYIGSFPVPDGATESFSHSDIGYGDVFDDVWIFKINPVDRIADASINFTPNSSSTFTGFSAELFNVDTPPGHFCTSGILSANSLGMRFLARNLGNCRSG